MDTYLSTSADNLIRCFYKAIYLNSICNLIPPLVSSPDTSLINPHCVILCNQDFLSVHKRVAAGLACTLHCRLWHFHMNHASRNLFFPLVQTEHGIILSSILMVPIAIATEISSCGHGPLGEAGKLLVTNYNTDTDGGCRNPSPHYWHCNSPFTLALNGYELVHGIVLKNGSTSVYTSHHNRCVYYTRSLVPSWWLLLWLFYKCMQESRSRYKLQA